MTKLHGPSTPGVDSGPGNAGGSNPGGANTGGSANTGGKSSTGGGDMGGASSGGGLTDPCAAIECTYGSQCVDGECQPLCSEGEVYCSGGCIKPLTDQQFCGATLGCDGGTGPNSSLGGAGGQSGEGTAGEACSDIAECVEGACKDTVVVPGSNAVIERDGYAVRCDQWEGRVCVKPWIRIDASRIVKQGSDEGCVDDTTSFRPVWFYDDGEAEAVTFCQVAVGSDHALFSTDDLIEETHGGWMYGVFASTEDEDPLCDDDFRKYAEVDGPDNVPNVVWSFDLMSEERPGEFLRIECDWP